MKNVLIITDNPRFKELTNACQVMEANGWKCWIEARGIPFVMNEYNFSWIIFGFDDYTIYQELKSNLEFKEFLANNLTPIKAIIREPWMLINDYLNLGFGVYSDWQNLIFRNFIV